MLDSRLSERWRHTSCWCGGVETIETTVSGEEMATCSGSQREERLSFGLQTCFVVSVLPLCVLKGFFVLRGDWGHARSRLSVGRWWEVGGGPGSMDFPRSETDGLGSKVSNDSFDSETPDVEEEGFFADDSESERLSHQDGTLSEAQSDAGQLEDDAAMTTEMEMMFSEMRRLFGFERSAEGEKASMTDELKRLLPVLQNVNSVAKSQAVLALEDRIEGNADQIKNLNVVLKQVELRKFREEEDEQYTELEQRLEELRYDLVMTHREAAELQAESKEMAFDLQTKRKQLAERKAREEVLAKPRVNILAKMLEELPQELSVLRRELYRVEEELQREKYLEKDILRSIEATDGTKRRTEQMIEILKTEVTLMGQREADAEKEGLKIGHALQAAETEFESCRRDATASTQDLLQRMQELYDIQDALLQEIKQHHENKVLKAIGTRAAQQANRMKRILASLTYIKDKEHANGKAPNMVTPDDSTNGGSTDAGSARSGMSGGKGEISESRRRVQELSRILSEREEHTKALETKVDLLKQKVETTERRLELARQERVKNARSLGAERVPPRGPAAPLNGKPNTANNEFQWLN